MTQSDKAKKEKASAKNTPKTDEKDKKSNLGALEEDDDFEEFPTEEWTVENNPSNNGKSRSPLDFQFDRFSFI